MEEDDRALWESASAWDKLPAYLPACPLRADELRLPYSLSRVQPQATAAGSLFSQQTEAMHLFYSDPPLTKPTKRHKPAMKTLALSTLASRQRTMDEFVGFAAQWLGNTPTMELVMRPLSVAKYLGFLLARGCAISTLKRAATHLGQAVTFVISEHCPGSRSWSGAWMEQVDDWYANLNSRLSALLSSHPINYTFVDLSLWEAWEHSLSAWASFKAAFQVGTCCKNCCQCMHWRATQELTPTLWPHINAGSRQSVDIRAC